MDCSYCKKDMGNSDICPHCGMGRRIDYELFKSDKEERKKSFEDYEKDYLDRVKNSDEIQNIHNPTPNSNNNYGYSPKVGKYPRSNSNKGLKIIAYTAFPIILGIIMGALMRAGSP